MDYSNTVTVTASPNAVSSVGAPAQRQREIPSKLDLMDKLLHQLAEETLGMNGTFGAVLAPVAPAVDNRTGSTLPSNATQIGDALDSFIARVQQSITTLQDIRSRCEL